MPPRLRAQAAPHPHPPSPSPTLTLTLTLTLRLTLSLTADQAATRSSRSSRWDARAAARPASPTCGAP
eukprot:scaffold113038_cov41-Phaeocystis_antarctica.AAC.1